MPTVIKYFLLTWAEVCGWQMADSAAMTTNIYDINICTRYLHYCAVDLNFNGVPRPPLPPGAVESDLASSDSTSLMVGDVGGSGGYNPTW